MPSEINRERTLIIVVMVCIGLFAADSLAIQPLIKLWENNSKKITDVQLQIFNGNKLLKDEARITKKWNEMVAGSRSTDQAVTESEVVKAVTQWSTSARLALSSTRTHWIVADQDCKKLEVRVSATGTIYSIGQFLYYVETAAQPLKVEDATLTSRDDRGGNLTCDVRLTRLVIEEKKR